MARTKQIKPEIQFFPAKLREKLDCIRRYPLTLIEAPSGFGKTTALRHFFYGNVFKDIPVYWHTCSEQRSDLSWKTFCHLLAEFDPACAGRLIGAGAPDEDTLPQIREILQVLSCDRETYLVLDDFGAWQQPLTGEFLMALSCHGGQGLHVVAVTQNLPWEDHCSILESSRFCLLREAVFTFSKEDTDTYFRLAGIVLNTLQLEEVTKATEGWIMALYLQMLSFIESGAFEKGSLGNLMRKALWDRLPGWERDFLLSVSIFSRFSLAQATALSGMSAADTEKLLREKRVFVHFDKEAQNFYLHSLFQRFLAEQFLLLPEERKKQIYLTGGDLAQQAGDRLHTLRHYYHAGAWEKLLALPLTSYEIADVMDETTKPMILDILEHTPFAVKRKYPTSMVALAFTLFFLHENEKLIAMEQEIQRIIGESALSAGEKNALWGEIELLLSFLEYNRIDAMSARHRKGLELLGGKAMLINVKSTWTFGSPSVLYMFYRESGKLDEELGQIDACMPYYYALTGGHGSGAETIMRAEAHFHRGELDEAEILCHKAIFIADSKQQSSIVQCGFFLLARIAVFRADTAMLQDALDALEARSRLNTEDLCRYTLDLARGFLYTMLHRTMELPPWLAQGDINDRRLVIMTQPFAYMIYGRSLLMQGEYRKLIGACQYSIGISSIFPNLLPQIYANLYLAQAYDALGNSREAFAALSAALAIALPDALYIPFAENYDGIKALLPAVAEAGGAALGEIARLARLLQAGLEKCSTPKYRLTPRERDILALVRKDLSNKEIAAALFISVSTVKTLLGRIYEKTGVSSKTQLVMLDI